MAPSHGFAAISHREAALRGAPASHGETAFVRETPSPSSRWVRIGTAKGLLRLTSSSGFAPGVSWWWLWDRETIQGHGMSDRAPPDFKWCERAAQKQPRRSLSA